MLQLLNNDVLNEISPFLDIKTKCIFDSASKAYKILTQIYTIPKNGIGKYLTVTILQQPKFQTLVNLDFIRVVVRSQERLL